MNQASRVTVNFGGSGQPRTIDDIYQPDILAALCVYFHSVLAAEEAGTAESFPAADQLCFLFLV